MSQLNVYQRIHKVMNEIGTIKKNGRNDFHKYDYASEADFVHALRPLLEKHGLVVIPVVETQSVTPPDDKGTILTSMLMSFTLINIDKPEEKVTARVLGQGSDKGDKGAYKAMTGAKKYWAALTFMVATGDDPEKDDNKASRKLSPVSKTRPSAPSNDEF